MFSQKLRYKVRYKSPKGKKSRYRKKYTGVPSLMSDDNIQNYIVLKRTSLHIIYILKQTQYKKRNIWTSPRFCFTFICHPIKLIWVKNWQQNGKQVASTLISEQIFIHIHMQIKVDKIYAVIIELVNKTPLRF